MATSKNEAANWRSQLYKSERMLIDELDRMAARGIAAAAPRPDADASAPEVTVVMPVWNRADLVATAIKSVLAQSFANWELVIIDDGSTDALDDALRPFRADPRIRIFHQPNSGECRARNRGVGLARSELVAYLDSDNFWYPDFLDAAVRVFRADPALEIAYGGIAYDWPNGDLRFYLLPYDRDALLRDNLADMNVIVHRRRTYERRGGFDEALTRALEWDLLLRYTVDTPAALIPVMGARYRIVAKETLSGTQPLANNVFRIRRKWWPRPETPPRVLLAAAAIAPATESQFHTELACARRFGTVAALWAPAEGAFPGSATADCPIFRGPLADAIAAFRPDVVHVRGLDVLEDNRAALAGAGVPVTLRGRGTDTAPDAIARAMALPSLACAYLMPGINAPADARLRHAATVFDTTLFAPGTRKDRRLILRAAPARPESDLRFLIDLAKLLPARRVVIAVATVRGYENEIAALESYRAETGSPAELLVDTPRAELACLFATAGIYLHSAVPTPAGTRPQAGGAASLVEAMATGAYVLARKVAPWTGFIGGTGAVYTDASDAAALIRATEAWSDAEWRSAQNRGIERAFKQHADELVLRPLFEDWCTIAREREAARVAAEAAAALA